MAFPPKKKSPFPAAGGLPLGPAGPPPAAPKPPFGAPPAAPPFAKPSPFAKKAKKKSRGK